MLAHPNVHQPWSPWSEDQRLHVAVAYSNPFRWRTRRELMNDFRHHMEQSPNVVLHVGEVAYGDRPHEVTSAGNPLDVQLRVQDSPLFLKENILNAVIQRFPRDWRYGAIIDADFTMTRHDWALEAVHQLQFYDFVQLFSSYADLSDKSLGSGMTPLRLNRSFAFNWHKNGFSLPDGYGPGGWKSSTDGRDLVLRLDQYGHTRAKAEPGKPALKPVGATGGAWAFRRSAFDTVGRLLDICVCGHGDWFMAFGLISEEAPDVGFPKYTDAYRRAISAWQKKAARLKQNIGYVDNFAVHHWHGSKFRRFYTSRYKILIDNGFDPLSDLVPDWQGIYSLSGDKPQLRDQMRRYLIERSEDSSETIEAAGEKPLV